MSKNVKILAIVLSVAAFGLISFAGTYAFLTAGGSRTNTVGIGTNTITVTEDFTPPDTINPGTQITKRPRVNNTGNTAVWVRARILFSDSEAQDFCENLDIDTTNWIYNATDGYYYYKNKLAVGASTTNMFTKVVIKSSANADDLKSFNVIVLAESTSGQAATYQAAWGV